MKTELDETTGYSGVAMLRLLGLRKRLFAAIEKELSEDSHCKSYEGAFQIKFPDYFQAQDSRNDTWEVSLDCYVVGPSRHYSWEGKTLDEAVSKAEHDVDSWIAEEAANR